MWRLELETSFNILFSSINIRYHIPRQYLHDEENTLVLFEEIGGSPYSITIQTVTVGKICADASEGSVLELSCQGGRTINEIKFVSFGMPQCSCGAFGKGVCESATAFSYVQQHCLYKDRCSINVNDSTKPLSELPVVTKQHLILKCSSQEINWQSKWNVHIQISKR